MKKKLLIVGLIVALMVGGLLLMGCGNGCTEDNPTSSCNCSTSSCSNVKGGCAC